MFAWSHASPVGDIVFVNGRVITGELKASSATGVAIRQGKIAAVGLDDEVRAWEATWIDENRRSRGRNAL